MYVDNEISNIRRRLMVAIVRMFKDDRLVEDIARLPQQIVPKDGKSTHRCCLYMDWAVLRYRIIALLGLKAEEYEKDECIPLSEFVKKSLERKSVSGPILTVMHVACTACNPGGYFVTNACQNCVAHPCVYSCPKKAISIQNNQAFIDREKCVNCGLCQKACPYHAITYIPVPCEEVCPVDAISKDENGKIVIDFDKCIFCGKCTRACPFSAIMERSEIIDVLSAIKSGRKVTAMVAPSIAGQFPAGLGQIMSALKQVGFTKVTEVAHGADKTSREEAAEFVERVKEGDAPLMGTSCCPAYVEAVKKHVPDFLKFVSHSHTPMSYSAEMEKEEDPDAVTVFIGPCLAKKHEALANPYVDYVLTFEEIGSILVGHDIEVAQCEEMEDTNVPGHEGRGFPVTGGVSQGVVSYAGEEAGIKPVLIDGLSKKNVKLLKVYASGKCPGNLVEVMACEGGCIAGPGVVSNPRFSTQHLKKILGETERKGKG